MFKYEITVHTAEDTYRYQIVDDAKIAEKAASNICQNGYKVQGKESITVYPPSAILKVSARRVETDT